MVSTLKDFAESAKYLTRNPLGVIGLFLVLVYGLASLVVSASKLEPTERLPLIWFLVMFSVLVLATFYRLVTRHHKKLYAPSDFRDESLFFKPLAEEDRDRKMSEEIESIKTSEPLIAERGVAQSLTITPADLRERYGGETTRIHCFRKET